MTERARSRKPDDPIDVPELPALPDGGLGANMPSWLRQAPAFMPPTSEEPNTTIDPGSLTAGLVLPEWLGELSTRIEQGGGARSHVTAPPRVARLASSPTLVEPPEITMPASVAENEPLNLPSSESPVPAPARARTVQVELPVTPEPYVEPPYRRIGFLLILFAIGVIAFTIWSATN